jgi:hypothetical protein
MSGILRRIFDAIGAKFASCAVAAIMAASEGDSDFTITDGFSVRCHSVLFADASMGDGNLVSGFRVFNSAKILRSSSTPDPPGKDCIAFQEANIDLNWLVAMAAVQMMVARFAASKTELIPWIWSSCQCVAITHRTDCSTSTWIAWK